MLYRNYQPLRYYIPIYAGPSKALVAQSQVGTAQFSAFPSVPIASAVCATFNAIPRDLLGPNDGRVVHEHQKDPDYKE
jgi:hypothetical protein